MALLTHLDLFSGAGGFALGALWTGGYETTQFVEIDDDCCNHLRSKWPGVPIHGDIRSFAAQPNCWDVVTAGFPCQDLSEANQKAQGLKGDRSGLWFETLRILRECRPRYLVLENVPSTVRRNWLRTVLEGLASSGYDARWSVVSCRALGARHKRRRLLLLAHPASFRFNADANAARIAQENILAQCRKGWEGNKRHTVYFRGRTRMLPLARGLRSLDGIPSEVDRARIQMMGNAIAPQVAMVPLLKALYLEKIRIKE